MPTFSYDNSRTVPNTTLPVVKKEPRPIFAKRAMSLKTNAVLKKINIALYPNPTNGELIYVLNDNDTYNYIITNILGQTLQKGVLNTDVNKINLEQLPKGVYLITITNKNYTQTDRIILE